MNQSKVKALPARTFYTIRWSKRLGFWCTYVGGCIIDVWEGFTKAEVVNAVAHKCDCDWNNHQVLSELRICTKAGVYQPARSYGHDPKSPG